MARVFVDTSAIYALVDRDDARHPDARRAFRSLKASRAEPVITNFIVAEVHALLLGRLDAGLARRWLLGNVWPVERVTESDEARAVEIIARYEDKTFSYTDATSFAVMHRLGLRRALAFDRHFRQFGFETV
jgi:predicted nucleic acid-binding protein